VTQFFSCIKAHWAAGRFVRRLRPTIRGLVLFSTSSSDALVWVFFQSNCWPPHCYVGMSVAGKKNNVTCQSKPAFCCKVMRLIVFVFLLHSIVAQKLYAPQFRKHRDKKHPFYFDIVRLLDFRLLITLKKRLYFITRIKTLTAQQLIIQKDDQKPIKCRQHIVIINISLLHNKQKIEA